MDLRTLRSVRIVAEAGSMTAAAERLGTVQSAVSARIAALEAELGVPLFERLARGVRPTAACLRLLPHLERLETQWRDATAAARGQARPPAGPFRLGAIEVAAATRLRSALAVFLQRHPGVELRVRTGVTRTLVAALQAGELDAAIVGEGVRAPGLVERGLGAERLGLLHSPGVLPGAAQQAFAFGPGCVCRERLTALLDRRRITAQLVEMDSAETMLGCVAAGLGIALLPIALADPGRVVAEAAGTLRLRLLHRVEWTPLAEGLGVAFGRQRDAQLP